MSEKAKDVEAEGAPLARVPDGCHCGAVKVDAADWSEWTVIVPPGNSHSIAKCDWPRNVHRVSSDELSARYEPWIGTPFEKEYQMLAAAIARERESARVAWARSEREHETCRGWSQRAATLEIVIRTAMEEMDSEYYEAAYDLLDGAVRPTEKS